MPKDEPLFDSTTDEVIDFLERLTVDVSLQEVTGMVVIYKSQSGGGRIGSSITTRRIGPDADDVAALVCENAKAGKFP